MQFTRCPLCHAVNIVHPGEPPSQALAESRNRCVARALTGKAGQGNTHRVRFDTSYWSPERGSDLCLFPLTSEQGDVLPATPVSFFRAFCQKDFSVRELTERVLAFLKNSSDDEQACE